MEQEHRPITDPAPCPLPGAGRRLLAKRAACPRAGRMQPPPPDTGGAEAPGMDGLFRAGDECASWGRGRREGRREARRLQRCDPRPWTREPVPSAYLLLRPSKGGTWLLSSHLLRPPFSLLPGLLSACLAGGPEFGSHAPLCPPCPSRGITLRPLWLARPAGARQAGCGAGFCFDVKSCTWLTPSQIVVLDIFFLYLI